MNYLKDKSNLYYVVYLVIIINFLVNFYNSYKNSTYSNFNFYDLASSLLLFLCLLLMGVFIKEILSLPYISTGIITYLLSFFVSDNIILFFYTDLQTSQLFIIVNIFWLFIAVSKRKFNLLLLITIAYLFLNQFTSYFYEKLNMNKNIIGDVKDTHFQHVKNIYEESYFFSINNSMTDGYPQLVAYLQALLNKISNFNNNFEHLALSVNVLFFLTILLIYELELKKISKFTLIILYTSLIYNSEWLKILFVDSLMTEGMVNYLFCTLLVSLSKQMTQKQNNQSFIFFLLGIMYFSKQFLSTIALLIILFYLLNKSTRKYAIYGLSGLIIKELSLYFHFKNITRNYHLRDVDFLDTIQDLILLRDVKLENILIIIKNLFIDKPFSILMIYFFILFIIYFFKFRFLNKDINLYTSSILINLVFVFIIYISIWRNVEDLESPIRFMLSFLYLLLVTQFKFIDELSNS